MHSFASLATDVEEDIFLLCAEPFGVSKNGAVWTFRAAVLPMKAEIDFMRELMSGLWLEHQRACVCLPVAGG